MRIEDVSFGDFRDGNIAKANGNGWNIDVNKNKKGDKSFDVTAFGISSRFSFSKYGLKQAIKFIIEKRDTLDR